LNISDSAYLTLMIMSLHYSDIQRSVIVHFSQEERMNWRHQEWAELLIRPNQRLSRCVKRSAGQGCVVS